MPAALRIQAQGSTLGIIPTLFGLLVTTLWLCYANAFTGNSLRHDISKNL